MAYSLYEETQPNSPKSVQYYPEEYEYPSYYQKISEVKTNYPSDQITRKTKKPSSSVNYINERKCPIYVHQYNNASTYNNYSYKNTTKPAEKNYSTKTKKIVGFPTTKSVLDQLEETYWATWKPNNKENVGAMSRKSKTPDNRIGKMKAYGDVADSIANYFSSSEYETTAVSTVEESDYEKYNKYETVIDVQEVCEKIVPRPKTTHSQEIQTDNTDIVALPKIEELIESDSTKRKEPIEVKQPADKKETTVVEKAIKDSELEESANADKSKLLKHTDSFIINKKKQGEVKERFQQPRCIRLYRKPGFTPSTFIRGGSYPLKSCLKREPVPKGNFRLGAPGSPLFVSTSSFHRRNRK